MHILPVLFEIALKNSAVLWWMSSDKIEGVSLSQLLIFGKIKKSHGVDFEVFLGGGLFY
jgi:hypothetical protein